MPVQESDSHTAAAHHHMARDQPVACPRKHHRGGAAPQGHGKVSLWFLASSPPRTCSLLVSFSHTVGGQSVSCARKHHRGGHAPQGYGKMRHSFALFCLFGSCACRTLLRIAFVSFVACLCARSRAVSVLLEDSASVLTLAQNWPLQLRSSIHYTPTCPVQFLCPLCNGLLASTLLHTLQHISLRAYVSTQFAPHKPN